MPTLTSPVKTKDAVELFVKDWGSGRPVVFTHGWPFNADSWDYHANALADAGYRVITYDKRGFGRSGQPSSGYDFDTLAADLAAVVDASDVREATLVGYSMGGGEIVRYLSRYGAGKIAKVALVGSIVAGLPRTQDNPDGLDGAVFDGIKENILANRPSFMAALVKDFIYDLEAPASNPVTPEVLEWSNFMSMQVGLRPLLSCVDAFGRTDFRPELGAVTIPTLILHGTADKPVPFEITAQVAAAKISKSRLIRYEGASHGILVTEKERVANDLLAFLRG